MLGQMDLANVIEEEVVPPTVPVALPTIPKELLESVMKAHSTKAPETKKAPEVVAAPK